MAAGIYIHIPFCVRKCLYCDFVSGIGSMETMQRYQNALLNEIESTVINETVDSVFFGGGTPSVYPVEYIEEIMSLLYKKFNIVKNISDKTYTGRDYMNNNGITNNPCEITIECNPGTLDMDKLYRYRKSGINRLSMGLQSSDNDELKTLGRIHTYEEFEQSFIMARKTGFTNINIDIMSAIPNQSLASYKSTLEKLVRLNPEHISAYSLIIEEGTVFYSKYSEGKECDSDLPDEDTDREMYHFTKNFLSKNGYGRYEISNYAKKEMECKHNLKYWSRDNYYGFGISAASLVDNVRYTNISDIDKYMNIMENASSNEGVVSHEIKTHIRETQEKIDIYGQMEEFMFLGLRKIKGINIKEFKNVFGREIHSVYGNVLDKMCENELMEYTGEYYRLSDKGIDVSNVVLAEFLL